MRKVRTACRTIAFRFPSVSALLNVGIMTLTFFSLPFAMARSESPLPAHLIEDLSLLLSSVPNWVSAPSAICDDSGNYRSDEGSKDRGRKAGVEELPPARIDLACNCDLKSEEKA